MAKKGYHTRNKVYKIDHLEIASIKEQELDAEIISTLEGLEVMTEPSHEMDVLREKNVYTLSTIREFARKSKDNDIDEKTRLKFVDLYFSINNYDYLMIIQ